MGDTAHLSQLVCMDPGRLTGSQSVMDAFRPQFQNMKVRQLSNALKHVAAVQHIATAAHLSDASWHLVLEDDAMVTDPSAMLAACSGAPADADILFFGIPTRLPHPVGGIVRYDLLEGIKILPACDAYAVRLRTARFMSKGMLPVRFRTEVHLSWLIATSGITTYFTSPNLSLDGSKLGVYVSTIETNNCLRFNSEYVRILHDTACGEVDIDRLVSQVKGMPFGGHPDMQVLLGRRLASAGRHAAARDAFQGAVDVYASEGGAVGMDSQFMGVYMDLFKFSQGDDVCPAAV